MSITNNNSSAQTPSNPPTPIFSTPSNSTPTSPKLVQQQIPQQMILQNLNHQYSPPKSPKSVYNYNNNTVFANVLVSQQSSFSSNHHSHQPNLPMNLPNSISMPHQILPSNFNLLDSDIPPQIPPRTPRNRTSLSSIHQRTNSESSTTSPNIQSQHNSAFNTPLSKQSTDDVFTFNQPNLQASLSSNNNNHSKNVLPLPPKGANHTYNSYNLIPPKLPPRRKASDRT